MPIAPANSEPPPVTLPPDAATLLAKVVGGPLGGTARACSGEPEPKGYGPGGRQGPPYRPGGAHSRLAPAQRARSWELVSPPVPMKSRMVTYEGWRSLRLRPGARQGGVDAGDAERHGLVARPQLPPTRPGRPRSSLRSDDTSACKQFHCDRHRRYAASGKSCSAIASRTKLAMTPAPAGLVCV